MTAPEKRSSYWHEGIYENGYYDLWAGERFIGWTLNSIAAIRWVIHAEISTDVVFVMGKSPREAAEIIMNHQLDGAET